MKVVVTTGVIRCAKLQSNRHYQQTNLQLFTDWSPFLSPIQQHQSTEGKSYHIPYLLPKLTRGLSILSLTIKDSWLSWEKVARPLVSPLTPVSPGGLVIKPVPDQKIHSIHCHYFPRHYHLSNSH